MNNPILIYSLIFLVGYLAGYIIGLIRSRNLEKYLSNEILNGKDVQIIVGEEGLLYKKEGNNITVKKFIKGENENDDIS